VVLVDWVDGGVAHSRRVSCGWKLDEVGDCLNRDNHVSGRAHRLDREGIPNPAASRSFLESTADPSVLSDLLGLAGVTVHPRKVVTWKQELREQARDWASAIHLSASDNDVEVPPRPAFLDQYVPGDGWEDLGESDADVEVPDSQ
jgi:hypothetical protein